MPRYLLDDSNASFSKGTWTFGLDHSLTNATRMQVRKATYTKDTNQTSPPHVLYVRSKSFHRLSKRKHTHELKSVNHEDSSDVLCVLEEQHDTGRYRLMSPGLTIPLRYQPLHDLDIYFTDPAGNDVTYFSASSSTAYPEVVDNMAAPSDTEKTGVIFRAFDTGGSGADYGNDEALNRSWESTNGKPMLLDFQSFASETTYDKLTVRTRNLSTDGWTDVFVDHTGSGVPASNPFTCLKIIKFWWTSDGSTPDNGWDALIYESWGSEGVLSGDSSAGFTLTVTTAGSTYGDTSTEAKFFIEADINTS